MLDNTLEQDQWPLKTLLESSLNFVFASRLLKLNKWCSPARWPASLTNWPCATVARASLNTNCNPSSRASSPMQAPLDGPTPPSSVVARTQPFCTTPPIKMSAEMTRSFSSMQVPNSVAMRVISPGHGRFPVNLRMHNVKFTKLSSMHKSLPLRPVKSATSTRPHTMQLASF